MNKKIKSTTLYRFDMGPKDKTPENIESDGFKYSYNEYDEFGNMLLEMRFNADGDMEEKYVNKFDKNGSLLEELNYLSEDEISQHKSYERDESGNVVNAYNHYQDGEKDTIVYKRNKDNKLIEKITIDSYEEEEARETIEYKKDKVSQRKIYEYDELVLSETYNYDDKGILTEHTKWTIEDEDSKFVNLFDEKGNLVKASKYTSKDKLIEKVEYGFEEDKLVKITEEGPYGTNTTSLEYDKNGNPVKQTELNPQGQLNNMAIRNYNENNDVTDTEVLIDFHGRAVNQHYFLKYKYEYFD